MSSDAIRTSTVAILSMALLALSACTAGSDLKPPNAGGGDGGDNVDQSGVTAPLVSIEQLAAGEECLAGGVTIRAGVDTDNDGALGDSEIEETFVVCNGPAGAVGDPGPKGDAGDLGEAGPAGEAGPKGDAGDPGEQGAAGDQGLPGDDGAQGEQGDQGHQGEQGDRGDQGEAGDDGLTALIRLEVEAPGELCPTGGVWVLAGLDADDDGDLSDQEVTEREVICNGRRGPGGNGEGPGTLIRLTEVDPGAECPGSGTRIEAGPDLDGDGELDDHEVDQSATICNGSLCDSPLWHDGGDGECIAAGTCIDGFHDGGDGSCVPAGECIDGMRDGGGGQCVPDGECAPNFRPDPLGGDGCVPACQDGTHDDGAGHCVAEGQCAEGFHDGGDGRCFPVGECIEGFWDGGGGICMPNGECSRRYVNVNGVCVENLESLFDFDSHLFSSCGASGPRGPELNACRGAYNGADWAAAQELFDVIGGIQQWTVPETGTYRLEAWGARGGGNGGNGAYMSGTFELDVGQVLQILVGQTGGAAANNVGNGGGGGSFIVAEDDVPLLIAGGGAGTGHNNSAGNAANMLGQTGPNGNGGALGNAGAGGQDGNGGEEGYTTAGNDIPNSGGGGGLITDGGSAGAARGGAAFINGGVGGDSTGGFGGGGGSNVFIYGCGRSPHGGSGGGYSGGGGGGNNCNGVGGGAGSFNSGRQPNNRAGDRAGHGQVQIALVPEP